MNPENGQPEAPETAEPRANPGPPVPEEPVPEEAAPESAAPEEAGSPGSERDAIVFLAGIGTVEVGDSIDAAARRIANALDDEADPADQFMLEEGVDEDYGASQDGKKASTRRITVVRKAGAKGPETPIVDLYSLDYRSTLIGDLPQKTPIKKLLLIFRTFLLLAPKLLGATRTRSKSATEKWQVRTLWLLFFGLGLYAFLVAAAVLGTLPQIADALSNDAVVGVSNPPAAAPLPPPQGPPAPGATGAQPPSDIATRAEKLATDLMGWLGSSLRPVTVFLQGFIVWITAVGLFSKFDFKAFIEKSGAETLSVSNYLSADQRKDSIAQQLSALLNHLAEKTDVEYHSTHVLTFSLGGVVAIDALFPKTQPRGSFRRVTQLVTIACPFDFVRTYWPDYFTSRWVGYTSRRWLNIYAPADILSSDFMDAANGNGAAKEAGVGVVDGTELVRPSKSVRYGDRRSLDEYPRGERLLLVGFKNHAGYWEEETAGCFGIVVRELFPDAVARTSG